MLNTWAMAPEPTPRGRRHRPWLRAASVICTALLITTALGCLSPSSGSDKLATPTPTPPPSDTPQPTEGPTPAEPTPTESVTETPTPEISPETTPSPGNGDSCTTFTTGSPRGLACIHCMHPNAHGQAFELARIMRDSCRADLAINVLIDGRFGNDDIFLGDLLVFLANGRNLTVVLYLSNGVSQRAGDAYNPNVFGTGNSTTSFRTRIVNDQGFREQYRNIVRRAVAIKARLPTNTRLVLIPQLEDNLTDAVFRNMLALTQEVAGDMADYGRSTCPGCEDGNGVEIPPGVLEDLHSSSPVFTLRDGMVTNDNSPFLFAYEVAQGGTGLSLADLARTRDLAQAQGSIFILWNAEYQGLPVQNNKVVGRPDPNVRNYALPNALEIVELVSFLQ